MLTRQWLREKICPICHNYFPREVLHSIYLHLKWLHGNSSCFEISGRFLDLFTREGNLSLLTPFLTLWPVPQFVCIDNPNQQCSLFRTDRAPGSELCHLLLSTGIKNDPAGVNNDMFSFSVRIEALQLLYLSLTCPGVLSMQMLQAHVDSELDAMVIVLFTSFLVLEFAPHIGSKPDAFDREVIAFDSLKMWKGLLYLVCCDAHDSSISGGAQIRNQKRWVYPVTRETWLIWVSIVTTNGKKEQLMT